MVSNAGFFKLGFNENSVLFVAKATSTLFAITNIILFWQIVRVTIKTYFYQVIAILLYSINSYTIASAVDGMETALYAFLVLISFLLWKKRTSNIGAYIGFVLASSLLILIRHEGALFLIPFGLALLIEKRWKILQDPIIYIWATVFFTYHIWHYLIFGELLTNPMLAKRHWPY
ncbi:MAG: glycosyltransferase family 39 protein, partial [Chloroflexota bacterium]